MLWKQDYELPRLTHQLKRFDYHVTIETNGRHFVPGVLCDLMSISPKLKSSTPMDDDVWRKRHDDLRINLDALLDLTSTYDYQLKFVIDSGEDLKEMLELLPQLDIDPRKVYLMAQARTRKELIEKKEYVIGYCMKYGFHYSPRLHIDIWDNRRGI